MINKNYPEHQIDIHGGGNDLKFPHHVNEMAQSRALYGTDIASYWLHNAMININGEKMSKSLNNFRLAKDLIEEYSGNVIRMALLSAPYRSPVNFTADLLNSSKMELNKILNASKSASVKLQLNDYVSEEVDEEIIDKFLSELSDDLNIANAFTVLYDLVKKLNMSVRSNDLASTSKYFNTLVELNKVLSFDLELKELTSEDKELYSKWDEAKKNKDFTKADEYRNILMERGIL
jgi:cysteinyl-tRNA synthetase